MAWKRPAVLALAVVLGAPAVVEAARHKQQQRQSSRVAANPIRKVVTMLQDMQTKVTEDGKHEQELYDKFMCYCKTNGGSLGKNIADAKSSITSLSSSLTSTSAQKVQTGKDLASNVDSRDQAKGDIAKADALREKEAAAFQKEEADSKANIAALDKAIAAIDKGMSGAFLQTAYASAVRTFAMERAELPDNLRQQLLVFLSGKAEAGYVPRSGEIVGILKEMHAEISKGLAEATDAEVSAQKVHGALVAAKTKEVTTLQAQIEEQQARVGRLGVEVTSISNDIEDTQEALASDTAFLSELESGCATKTQEWEVIKKTRAEELVALAETIKVINDDDALELFKKTLPGASASFTQIMVSEASMRARALSALQGAVADPHHPELRLITLALRGKKGFDKVLTMIDSMVSNLKTEQTDDDGKKEYCGAQFDATDDKKKGLELSASDSQTAIAEMKGNIATLTDEIATLEAGIKALDKSVAEATELRKSEHVAYTGLITDNTNTKDLLLWAKNRLNKFYNPKMYKAPPKRQLSDEDQIVDSFGGEVPTVAPGGIAGTGIGLVQLHSQSGRRTALPPPPETFGAYTKKSEQGNGVVAMMDLLIKDLDKEMAEADVSEKDAQKEYESMMADASKKRAGDAKMVTDKGAAKAAEEEALQAEIDKKTATAKELAMTLEYIHGLHQECDWLLKYYDTRKAARDSEIDALGNAKAVLSGSDYSF